MTLEQRLYRAANEIREVPVDVPDFVPSATSNTSRRLLPTVVTSLLFVVGALAVLTGATTPDAESAVISNDLRAVAPVEVTVSRSAEPPLRLLTPREELMMITSLGERSTVSSEAAPVVEVDGIDDRIPPGAS